MNEKLLTQLNCINGVEVVEAIAGKPAAFYAQLANLVFDSAEQGDVLAREIVAEGAGYISSVARTLWKQNPPSMSLIGGLTLRIKPWLDKEIQQKLSEPMNPPEVGSVLFARQQLEK